MPRLSLLLLAVLAAAAAFRRTTVDARIVDGLRVAYYDRTCPEAENAVRDIVSADMNNDPTIAAGIIRIFFHDCFVKGCDASILLDETPSGAEGDTEKDSPANGFTLNGLSTIDMAKATIETLCPRTVSCADILAFAARDAAVAAGHSGYDVAAGRRDGRTSIKSDVRGNLPVPSHNAAELSKLFAEKGLSQEDMVVLSGAHSIGGAHCFMFSERLYNFSGRNDMDPAMDQGYGGQLRNICPAPGRIDDPESAPKVAFDAWSEQRLDSSYYSELLAGRGLLSSDNALVEDPATRATVEQMAWDVALWHRKFGEAMQRLGMVDVLLGEGEGEIRRDCRAVNGPEEVSQFLPSFF